eukprot:3425042-Pyramimonas_sp.AAC.1
MVVPACGATCPLTIPVLSIVVAGLPFVALFIICIFLFGTTAPCRTTVLKHIRGLRNPPGFRGRPSVNIDAR